VLDWRSAEGRAKRLADIMAGLVRLKVANEVIE
jgi:hypothetical protein